MIGNIFQNEKSEIYGVGSRCIEYKTSYGYEAKCHQASCQNNVVTIKVGSKLVECKVDEKGIRKPVDDGSLECPDTVKFCGILTKSCPDDCSINGVCREDEKCSCFSGWTGLNCSEKIPNYSVGDAFTPSNDSFIESQKSEVDKAQQNPSEIDSDSNNATKQSNMLVVSLHLLFVMLFYIVVL